MPLRSKCSGAEPRVAMQFRNFADVVLFTAERLPYHVVCHGSVQTKPWEAARQWARTRYGRNLLTTQQYKETKWLLLNSSVWDYIQSDFFFKHEYDAAVFKIFWG